jgi:hypothetical protein
MNLLILAVVGYLLYQYKETGKLPFLCGKEKDKADNDD